jgi:hypothetical protein
MIIAYLPDCEQYRKLPQVYQVSLHALTFLVDCLFEDQTRQRLFVPYEQGLHCMRQHCFVAHTECYLLLGMECTLFNMRKGSWTTL